MALAEVRGKDVGSGAGDGIRTRDQEAWVADSPKSRLRNARGADTSIHNAWTYGVTFDSNDARINRLVAVHHE
jgi:hypothetical protein